MSVRHVACLTAGVAFAGLATSAAPAQTNVQAGTLTCDVSAGIGMILTQKQTMTCSFVPLNGGPPDLDVGRIDQFGVAIGAVQQGTLVWGVLAPASGVPHGALAGTYAGLGAQAVIPMPSSAGRRRVRRVRRRRFATHGLSASRPIWLPRCGSATTITRRWWNRTAVTFPREFGPAS